VEAFQKLLDPKNSTKVIFKNGQELFLTESLYRLEKQMYRTWMCRKVLEGEVIKL